MCIRNKDKLQHRSDFGCSECNNRRKTMKLAVAISQAGPSQVLIKRPRDRGDSVGNRWERID